MIFVYLTSLRPSLSARLVLNVLVLAGAIFVLASRPQLTFCVEEGIYYKVPSRRDPGMSNMRDFQMVMATVVRMPRK
jgi:hypothetical protein